jgi:diguanylate cyclase (GGDEF)-like protein
MQYENFTILAVDDKKENLDLLLHILQNFDVIPATSGEKALQIVEDEKIDLILLDIMMPNMDGFDVCRVLKNNPDTKDIPIIFATAKTDEQSIAKAYEVGGDDFVSKPLKKAEVIARVKIQLQIKTQIEELEFLASRDSMTGIYNRRKFFELASSLFEKTEENLFISMIDIDYFKKINDTYGHDAGDIVIKTMAQLVSELLPSDAIFGRIGGEEFAILLENERQEVLKIFENIKNNVANLQIEANSDTIRFTISNGIAQRNNQTNSVDELLKAADEALYEAKGTGRNKVILRQ